MELLEELHQAGKTIIISTHDVELAYPWADRAILLREGEILQEDIPEVASATRTWCAGHGSRYRSSSSCTRSWPGAASPS